MSNEFVGKDVFGNKVFMAETDGVDANRSAIDRILLAVGEYMGWDGDISEVFVSDLSSFGDFCLEEAEYIAISEKIGVNVGPSDYLFEVAKQMTPNI